MRTIPDALFPTDNEYDIPLLDPRLQADFVDAPVIGWGAISRRSRMRGTWHFYVDDAKFSSMWGKPDMVTNTKAVSCAEANYTTTEQLPLAVGIYRIFQKRWLSRYWQERGLRIFADLYVAERYRKINQMGLPKGWASFATSARDFKLDLLRQHVEDAEIIADGNPLKMLVYGGGPKVHEYCGAHQLVHIPDARNEARKKDSEEL
jgi:hypothetical protein